MSMKLKVTVNGTDYDVVVDVEPEPTPTLGSFLVSGGVTPPPAEVVPTHARAPATEEKVLRAPISGTVVRVNVDGGQVVEPGDTLLVLEAMKMETEITAPVQGKVAAVTVAPGEAVSGGQVLVEFE